jgi:wyosine [tRNA(Phe)-imidazoG37] synthetase (radical SAM superfamily)
MGVSLGINLNINNSCNWRCLYCQVENLKRANPITINLEQLQYELKFMLDWILKGDFLVKYAPPLYQRFNDIALSGNGEPTLSIQFPQVIEVIQTLRQEYNISSKVKTILITNGSKINAKNVLDGLNLLNNMQGEIWFKIDQGSEEGIKLVNQVNLPLKQVINNLSLASKMCKTYIQTCLFKINNISPSLDDIENYLSLLKLIKPYIQGILLYSVARTPMLPEGKLVSKVSIDFLIQLASQIKQLGINDVRYYE